MGQVMGRASGPGPDCKYSLVWTRALRHRARARRRWYQRRRRQVRHVRHAYADYLGWRAGTFPKIEMVAGRGRHWLDRVGASIHGPLVGRSSWVDGAETAPDAQLLLPAPVLRSEEHTS